MSRTGKEYLASIDDGRVVWHGSERVKSVVSSRYYRNAAASFAALFDAASNPDDLELFNYRSADRLRQRGFQIPATVGDLLGKRSMHEAWARYSFGFLGRTPDYMASGLAGFMAAKHVFEGDVYDGRQALERLYQDAADGSKFISFTLTNIRPDRRVPLSRQNSGGADIGVRAVRETDGGIYVSGVKAVGTAALFSDEIIVGSIEPLDLADTDYALTFSIPPATAGVSLISRQSYEANAADPRDNPLSSRFDENDAMLVLDQAFVPWERVLTYRDTKAASAIWWETPAYVYMAQQASIRFATKLRFLAGLACLAARANGLNDNPQVRMTLGRLLGYVEMARSMVLGAEADHEMVPGTPGAIAPNRQIVYAQRIVAAELYPKFVHELRMLCGGSLIYVPRSVADLDHPEVGKVIASYMATTDQSAVERTRLLKLIWDATSSEFAARHAHYEQFYQGAPHVYFSQMATENALSAYGAFAASACDDPSL
ncbi:MULTISPECIES: 4-hydroxyphenylacetate 3-hydroxylase family protein [unclassified Ensifer]|uniref:4-hydroxyphenylacetate 3-hydroxylase family protein n=1 Tax=unclassified Ensifer TaxID=2633371 RepID=UPI00300F8960